MNKVSTRRIADYKNVGPERALDILAEIDGIARRRMNRACVRRTDKGLYPLTNSQNSAYSAATCRLQTTILQAISPANIVGLVETEVAA